MFVIIRVLSAPIAAVLVCFVYAWFATVPRSERVDHIYYLSFNENFVIPLLFAVPIYLIFGLPYSILVDQIFKHRPMNKYGKEALVMLIYMAGGVLALLFFFIIMSGGAIHRLITANLLLLGSVSAWVYYVVIRSFEAVWSIQLRREGAQR